MTSPLPTKNLLPVTQAHFEPTIVEPIEAAALIPSPYLTPLERDCLNEELLEISKRTCSPFEVLQTLVLSNHQEKLLSLDEWVKWQEDNEYPQGQSDHVVMKDSQVRLAHMTIYKGTSSFAVKMIPVIDGELRRDMVKYCVGELQNG